MTIYKCMTPGCDEYSLDNTKECPICGEMDWEEVDQSQMTSDDWKEAFEFAESSESEFAIAQALAETGSISGLSILGGMYLTGVGGEKDETKTFELWSEAAKRNNPEAICSVGVLYIAAIGVKQDIAKGLSMLWKANDLKDSTAPYILGTFYDSGDFVTKDEKKALKLFKTAAERGDPGGMYVYGVKLVERAKSEKEFEAALSWLWRAARKDEPHAQLALGFFLRSDVNENADDDQAGYWLHRAAVNECEGAASALAEFRLDGVDDELDDGSIQEIFELLHDALERGDYTAAKTLGDLYRDGIYVEQDFERAYKFYRQGQGTNTMCSVMVAHCYRTGEGVNKNPGVAFKIYSDIYEECSEDGNIPMDVILELADMYEKGEGTVQNRDESARLFSMAAAARDPRGMGQMGIFIMEKHPFVKGSKDDALELLSSASNMGDLAASLYLAKYYLSLGDRERAEYFMEAALIDEIIQDATDATEFAKEYFPDLLDEYDWADDDEDCESDQGEDKT